MENKEQVANMVSPLIYIGGQDENGQPVQIVSAQLILDVQAQMVGITIGQYDSVESQQLIPFDGMPLGNFQRASIDEALKVVTQAIKLSINNYLRVLVEGGNEIDEMGEHFIEHMASVMYLEPDDIASENLVGAIGELQENLRYLIAFGQTKQQAAQARRPKVMPAVRPANSPTLHAGTAVNGQPPVPAVKAEDPQNVPVGSAPAEVYEDEPLDEERGAFLSELLDRARKDNYEPRTPDLTSPTTTAAGMPIVQPEQAPAVAAQEPAPVVKGKPRKPAVSVQTI